jgi:hypothetical protein
MDSRLGQTLFMALEFGQRTWKLAFSPGLGGKARQRAMAGGDEPPTIGSTPGGCWLRAG